MIPPKAEVEQYAYQEFLKSKQIITPESGIVVSRESLNNSLFDFQKDCVIWALKKGRAAFWWDCGMGKTAGQLQWSKSLNKKIIIFTPLAVAEQTVKEGQKFDVEVVLAREPVDAQITVTNYEIAHKFNPDDYDGVVLDESGCLKHHDSKTRQYFTDKFRFNPYKLCCSATPCPNDFVEIGNHSEFLGNLTRAEMLSTFFVHDGGNTSQWRLKGHAQKDFWTWICTFAVMLRRPSDLDSSLPQLAFRTPDFGYDDDNFILPELRMHEIIVENNKPSEGFLFPMPALTLTEQRAARRSSLSDRVQAAKEIIDLKDKWVIWCELDAEQDELERVFPECVSIRGKESPDMKISKLHRWLKGEVQGIISKPSIFGWGSNWQLCHKQMLIGISHSWEQFYQVVRRCWRFGQEYPVDCYIVISSQEGAVLENIKHKEASAQTMAEEMVNNMHELNQAEIKGQVREEVEYKTACETGDKWNMMLGDNCELIKSWPKDSAHYICSSLPFASLYTYSATKRDVGNCRTHAEFWEHMSFLIPELLRVLMPGRLLSFHCMNLPTSKERDGVIGLTDFRGDVIRACQKAGFIYHSEVCIWKNPVTAMQRTKALGLLHKQIKKDSCMSRQGIPDYLVTLRKPGDNPERVTHTNESFPVSVWQNYASPVWFDINPSDTLQKESAREHEDERHIAPLQLEVIKRACELWTNPNDIVFDPFMGIGSVGYQAIKMGRRAIGVELKESYYKQACLNLKAAELLQGGLFSNAIGFAEENHTDSVPVAEEEEEVLPETESAVREMSEDGDGF